ncbi:OmpA family protein [Dyadobacter sp. CY347]|uniref:OmpA family protein n=1 Tax=Dyadobacter sp. CY347 TaxID=2909336 RepID=UPI001F360561|nr:OmpA family protein [Dyadobacter sp. CY347]MCF2487672.1 OmpA family protein [Dyadobacter sp. CY347]
MKKITVIVLLGLYSISCPAQLLDRIKNRVEQKVVDQIDHSIDKATEKKKQKDKPGTPDSSGTQTQSEPQPTSTSTTTSPEPATPAVAATTGREGDITSYSKFDFVAGSKIIMHEDFSQDEVGDFPANWNTRSGAELVNVAGSNMKWLRMNQDGVFYPEYLNSDLPEHFTLQLKLMANKDVSNIGEFMISLIEAKDTDQKFAWGEASHISAPSFKITFQPTSSDKGDLKYSTNLIGSLYKHGVPEFNTNKTSVNVSIWRQKQRVRVYLDSTKVLDLPRALDPGALLNTLVFSSDNPDFNQKGGAFFLSDIRLAVGAADTRNKLVTEGKFVTHGILFDTNSEKIQPQSYGTLKDIAQVLQENAALRIQIVGHTDTDGNEQANVDLSKRRAAAVRNALVSTFGINDSRMETDGKGQSQPVDTNDTPVGKANNRRVELIKLDN